MLNDRCLVDHFRYCIVIHLEDRLLRANVRIAPLWAEEPRVASEAIDTLSDGAFPEHTPRKGSEANSEQVSVLKGHVIVALFSLLGQCVEDI